MSSRLARVFRCRTTMFHQTTEVFLFLTALCLTGLPQLQTRVFQFQLYRYVWLLRALQRSS